MKRHNSDKPTVRAYQELQEAFDWYNQHLFEDELPDCLLTFQREKKTMGYFSKGQFVHQSGEVTDEIALNPEYFPLFPPIEIMQTLVHEMVHLWQHHYGNPSRGRYHNAQWAAKMVSIGLIPSSTGKPGGARTGQKIGDYPEPGGKFEQFTLKLFAKGFAISWYDRFPPETKGNIRIEVDHEMNIAIAEQWRQAFEKARQEQQEAIAAKNNSCMRAEVIEPEGSFYDAFSDADELIDFAFRAPSSSTLTDQLVPSPSNRSNRYKYACGPCRVAVWGKPGLSIMCGLCGEGFKVVGEDTDAMEGEQ